MNDEKVGVTVSQQHCSVSRVCTSMHIQLHLGFLSREVGLECYSKVQGVCRYRKLQVGNVLRDCSLTKCHFPV